MRRPDPASVGEASAGRMGWEAVLYLPRVRRGREEGVTVVDVREKLVGLIDDALQRKEGRENA